MTPDFKSYHKELQKMFPELEDSCPAEEWYKESYNDGGQIITTIWEGPGRHTKTSFNDLSLVHPDTTIQVVERYEFKEWRIRAKEPPRTYGGKDG